MLINRFKENVQCFSVLSGTDLPQKELMSADMQRELVRQKWEEHERLTASNPDDPIHYANVQYNGKADYYFYHEVMFWECVGLSVRLHSPQLQK